MRLKSDHLTGLQNSLFTYSHKQQNVSLHGVVRLASSEENSAGFTHPGHFTTHVECYSACSIMNSVALEEHHQ